MRYLFSFLLFILILSCSEENASIENTQVLNEEELTAEIERFGKKLFFDKRLSLDNTVSCSSCHNPQLAFADTVAISPGVEGRLGSRNAPSLLNVSKKPSFMLDGAVSTLEMQALVPIQDHNEMSIPMGVLVEKLRGVDEYEALARQLFEKELDAFVITRALAAYERTLVATKSPFDEYLKDPVKNNLSDGEQRGWVLFKEKRCIECHELPDFTNYTISASGFELDSNDLGRYIISGDSADVGKFVVPSLRNSSITYPYLHNGALTSLEDVVLLHYSKINQQTNRAYPAVSQYDANFIARFMGSLTTQD